MLRKPAILVILTLIVTHLEVHSQDPVFSHFYSNSLELNPSLAGVEEQGRIYIGYRNHWPLKDLGSSFVTYQASYDQYLEKIHGGFGIHVMNDRLGGGIFNTFNLDLMYAYHFKATRRWSFAGALQAGMGQRSVNTSGLLFGNMIDPLTGAVDLPNLEPDLDISPHIYPDFAAGGTAFYNNYYGGIAVHHILNPSLNGRNETIEQIPRKYTLHFGAIFPVIEKRLGKEIMKLSPNFVFMQQQNIQQINYGLDVLYKDILAGIWTRHDFRFNYGNIIFTVGYSSSNLRFRYSYEFKLSRPTIALTNLAAHEISLLIITDNRTIRNKHSAIKCPKF